VIAEASRSLSLCPIFVPQVCEVTGLCRSMIYQLEADLRFPQRVKIGIRAVGWLVPIIYPMVSSTASLHSREGSLRASPSGA
jgi:predicted DNA-binding transcriptional regulator AlpA